ncbi:hypothetical protein J5N97_030282 [Dioscorea zingiberensis]|uniref:Uncharacterized protein n=1 Tax=Dioscorea zingiberensis TaxID=325984 RepID=A0A9D5BXI3_9LILI|nr:hypothetical protein J5N97_030282 [Dioscorea zingiberensis]
MADHLKGGVRQGEIKALWGTILKSQGGVNRFTNDIHKERLVVIKKSMVGSGDSGNTKNPASAQAAANSKSHATKPLHVHSPKT